jgi:trimeric autotransporter adhesin
VPGIVTINKATTTTTITSHLPSPSTIQQAVVVAFTVAPQFTGTTPTGNVTVTASGGGTCTATVAAGSCPITFTTAGTRTLTAVYAGNSNFLTSTSVGVSQTVNAPTVSLSPPNLNFGNTTVNTTSVAKAETITNTGTGALINFSWSITGTNANNFAIAPSTTCTTTLAPGANCLVNITFTPSATGTRTASLTLTDNATNSPQTVGLSGTGK